VWPESAIPDDLAFDRAAWLRLSAFVDELGTTLATGAVGSAVRSDGGIIRFNSVHVIRPRHGMLSYHKRLPVPLAESWPAALGAPPPSLDPVAAGRELVVFDVGTTRFGSLICFEIADAPSARALAARGARFIVNVTNDVWFAGGRAPHEVWVIVRAVESGRPVVRAPNLGTAAIVDPFGRAVTSARATGGPAVLAGAIPDPVDTVYVRTGEVFLPLCLVVVGAGLLPRRRRVIPPGSMAG